MIGDRGFRAGGDFSAGFFTRKSGKGGPYESEDTDNRSYREHRRGMGMLNGRYGVIFPRSFSPRGLLHRKSSSRIPHYHGFILSPDDILPVGPFQSSHDKMAAGHVLK